MTIGIHDLVLINLFLVLNLLCKNWFMEMNPDRFKDKRFKALMAGVILSSMIIITCVVFIALVYKAYLGTNLMGDLP